VATAATLAATSASQLTARIDAARGSSASGSMEAAAGPAAAFADADIFDLAGAGDENFSLRPRNSDEPIDSGAQTIEGGDSAPFDVPRSPPVLDDTDENISSAELDDFENAVEPEDDDEELSVGESPKSQAAGDFDAEASAFFDDNTVGPTSDDESNPSLGDDGDGMFDIDPDQVSLDEKLEKAGAILDAQSDGSDVDDLDTVVQSGTQKLDDPNDLTLEQFLETDSFDAPPTIPPAMPRPASADEGDVTLEAFMSTSMFEGRTVKLTNEDATVLPFQVPDEPNAGMDPGETVKLPRRPKFDDEEEDDDDDDESEDPTILR
jgi:hypothetical protein